MRSRLRCDAAGGFVVMMRYALAGAVKLTRDDTHGVAEGVVVAVS